MVSNSLLRLLICFTAQFHASFAGQVHSLDSVPDLERSMFRVIDGFPCVRLLNISGEIGCANPGREKVVAPIVRFNKADGTIRLPAILISLDEFQPFFERVAGDPEFSRNIGGVLVEAEIQDKLKGLSPAEKFPQAKFAPYQNIDHKWNPNGSGIMWNAYNFPVFLLSNDSTSTLKEVAIKNEKNKKDYSIDVAEFHLVMQTTRAGTHNSESCLKERTCLPLGGFSVWSSLPPINVSSSESSKSIVLAVASMDSAAFFRDKSFGADSPNSGLIALMAAVDALSNFDDFKSFKKQLVFLVFTGEAWGYLGSRRFLHELDLHSDAVKGLNSTLIEMVIEIGSVGKGFNHGVNTLFAHSAADSLATNETLNALRHAQVSLKSESIQILTASPSNPGIPPSSLMTFLKKNSQASGVVLEDFDAVFANEFYHSHLDDISNINSTSIVAAASLVARSLYILANDMNNLTTSDLSAINVNSSLVEELLGCLLSCDPGLSCGLVKNYISPSSSCPGTYVGVVVGDPSTNPSPGYSSDISRFIWNFLADKTSVTKQNSASNCLQGCRNSEDVCIRSETDGKGVCVTSTTRYVPAYSTRLRFESGAWTVLPPNTSDPMGMVDPVWTESNWDVIGLRVYTKQDSTYDNLVLLGGLGVTIFSYIAVVITRAFITKTLKSD
ncbi:hypothetical protein Nepgr_032074 [Nepenthes gracilis]|uniref:Nicastrin n=1 Tax=Nepenthes gracilis TaxID=150966 RepID=A0AAD3TJM6_NEPGR|nr:hypothetical protein Nepgr_032074 [Nepenthes gracilis]